MATNNDITNSNETTEPKKKRRNYELSYKCPHCNRSFKQKPTYIRHLGRKRPCYEERGIEWISSNFDSLDFKKFLADMDALFDNFYELTEKCKSAEDVDICRKRIRTLARKVEQLKATVRSVAYSKGEPAKYDKELREFDDKVELAKAKYKLLIF